ncbi:MAG TPA: carbohydrate binding family 9 domain-containing protein, partial [Micropepsaceae bacterium]|nr:carbohydrate binding family 9 domain-containing protein [Micropepsaceae bacterium]
MKRVFGSWGARTAPALLLLLCAAMSGLPSARAAAPAAMGQVRPSAKAVRIDISEAPIIDGDLSDPVWAKAGVIDKFTQKSPNPGEPATERTVLRILYDQNNLYFGFYAYDSHPDEIIPGSMERDGRLASADSVALYIDPGQTRRNAYNFELGASGGRTDELELNNTTELREWNTIWSGRAKRV